MFTNPHALNAQALDLIIEDSQVFTPNGLEQVDVGVLNGKIVAIEASLKNWTATKRIAGKGLTTLPGVIDSQVHFREPGLDHKENLE